MNRVTLTVAMAMLTAVGMANPVEHGPPIDWTPAPLSARPGQSAGYVQFQRACSVCHGSGPGKPGSRALAVKYKGSLPALLEERQDLKAPYIKQVVRQGLTVMPFFRKTELSDADLTAITEYLTRKR